jgi:hypothetical protein
VLSRAGRQLQPQRHPTLHRRRRHSHRLPVHLNRRASSAPRLAAAVVCHTDGGGSNTSLPMGGSVTVAEFFQAQRASRVAATSPVPRSLARKASFLLPFPRATFCSPFRIFPSGFSLRVSTPNHPLFRISPGFADADAVLSRDLISDTAFESPESDFRRRGECQGLRRQRKPST